MHALQHSVAVGYNTVLAGGGYVNIQVLGFCVAWCLAQLQQQQQAKHSSSCVLWVVAAEVAAAGAAAAVLRRLAGSTSSGSSTNTPPLLFLYVPHKQSCRILPWLQNTAMVIQKYFKSYAIKQDQMRL